MRAIRSNQVPTGNHLGIALKKRPEIRLLTILTRSTSPCVVNIPNLAWPRRLMDTAFRE